MRRALAVAAIGLSAGLVPSSGGCGSDEPEIENLCAWLGNADNCYRRFYQDVGTRCGAEGRGNAPKGGFAARDKLDVCVLAEGGQVLFDPPLDLAAFPLASASFKLIAADGTSCGAGSFSGTYSYSLSVTAFPPDGGAASAGGGAPSDPIAGGSFSSQSPPGRDVFDTSCPSGEAHHFNRLQTQNCEEYAALVPRAELESSAGGINIAGFVRFRVLHPPLEGELTDAQPSVVEYFDCSFEGAPEPCADGVQNGTETDEDCGGALCAARCEDGQSCIGDDDCSSGSCAINAMGFKKCAAGSGAGGAGGTGGAGGGAGGG